LHTFWLRSTPTNAVAGILSLPSDITAQLSIIGIGLVSTKFSLIVTVTPNSNK
jgi:hypothetical protein